MKAYHYLCGLFYTEKTKRNIERMCEQNAQDYQSQHHFITSSPWSAAEAMKVVARKTNHVLGDIKKQALIIDESSNKKAGNHSVGVSRQHNGNLGKVENSQTGVYAALAMEDKVCLINCRLFLPQKWIDDTTRCKNAGIPVKDICFKTKPQLAIDMIKEMDKNGVDYGWVGADGLYGASSDFRDELDNMQKKYVVDIHRDQMVFLEKPEIFLPEKRSKKGRKVIIYETKGRPQTVESYLKSLEIHDWTEIKYRKGTKGWICADFNILKVWVWNKFQKEARSNLLIIRKSKHNKKDEIKYSLSNFDMEKTSKKELAYMQGQRYLVEDSFKDSKGELGLTDYQIRKYQSWYHHQALTMIAMQFILEIIVKNQDKLPLLSVRDVRLQLIAILKEQGVQIEQEISMMINRHVRRARDIMLRYKNEKYIEET